MGGTAQDKEVPNGIHSNYQGQHRCRARLLRHVRQTALAKKEWLKRRFAEGLIFYRSVDAENASSNMSPRRTRGSYLSGWVSLHRLSMGRRLHERARIFQRPVTGVREGCEGAGAEGIVYFVCRRTQARIPLRREIPCAQGFHGCGHVIMRNHAHVPAVRFGHGASAIQRMRQISHGGW